MLLNVAATTDLASFEEAVTQTSFVCKIHHDNYKHYKFALSVIQKLLEK